jgi:hypothetical protein
MPPTKPGVQSRFEPSQARLKSKRKQSDIDPQHPQAQLEMNVCSASLQGRTTAYLSQLVLQHHDSL